ncbi:MAG: energy transducer TonB [bacterium]|nr:energy transducer TonB [bacterium]
MCEKTGTFGDKKRINSNSYLSSFKIKEGIIERDHSALKELEDINLKTHLKNVFISDQTVISKATTKDTLDYLNISKDTVSESPLDVPIIEKETKFLAKDNENLLNNLSYTTKISGPISLRKVLYQEGFKIPSWVEKEGLNLQGRFRFWVLSNGYVDRVSIEESFGDRRIDSLASSAISKWRFSRLSNYLKNQEEWGLIDIKILLR